MQLPNLVMCHFLLSNLHTHGHMIYDNLPVLINLKFNKCGVSVCAKTVIELLPLELRKELSVIQRVCVCVGDLIYLVCHATFQLDHESSVALL